MLRDYTQGPCQGVSRPAAARTLLGATAAADQVARSLTLDDSGEATVPFAVETSSRPAT
jgi:hypothetical protein